MPSVSKAQQKLMQIAEHHPEQVSPQNRGVLKMSRQSLHDFASGPMKGKPAHVGHPIKNLKHYAHPPKVKR